MDLETDPGKFFKSVKRLQGTKKQKTPYLHNGRDKVFEPKDKEILFREHRENIFRNAQEDGEFDQINLKHVETTITVSQELITPFPKGDLARLNNEFPLITLAELKHYSKFKSKKPQERLAGLASTHLKHLPTKKLKFLLYIFNMSLSMCYLPHSCKHAIIIFIPKGATTQRKVENYRPISLLNVLSGKKVRLPR